LLEARWQARLQEVTELALAYHDAAAAAGRGPGGHERQVRLRSLLRRTTASRRALADTEEALARLSAGRYGWCEGCAGAIPAERLAVTPETRYCARCDGGRPGMARDGRLRWPARDGTRRPVTVAGLASPSPFRRPGVLPGGGYPGSWDVWPAAREALMPRRIGYPLAFGAAAALVWAGWPGPPGNPATVVHWVDVIVAVVLLAGLPWAARRVFGPAGDSRLARAVRVSGYAAVFILVLVKGEAERLEYAAPPGRALPMGAWIGEVAFLAVMAAYVAGLLAVTARRPPAGPAALAAGTAAGVAVGLVVYTLPPLGNPLHATDAWVAGMYGTARVLAVPLVLATVVAAGLAAARRTSGRGSRLPLADARARQGVAAGLCAGGGAALLVSLLGISTTVLLPHEVNRFQWALPDRHLAPETRHPAPTARHLAPGTRYLASESVYRFEVNVSHGAAGYLSVLVFFPLLGAGLGAWGGLCAVGRPGRRPGGGGGGGGSQEPGPPPPGGGRRLDGDREPVIVHGRLPKVPAGGGVPGATGSGQPAPRHPGPRHPGRIPARPAGRSRPRP
jgi:RNA polymerase-binding transcription factor DksA